MALLIKRIYDMPEASDGIRILVDRLWPRGLTKEKARIDEWMRELAPSDTLRKWFAHRADRFHEFALRYEKELLQDEYRRAKMVQIANWANDRSVTLLYAAKNSLMNNAAVLQEVITRHFLTSGSQSETSQPF